MGQLFCCRKVDDYQLNTTKSLLQMSRYRLNNGDDDEKNQNKNLFQKKVNLI